jgi:hypothetical protein
VPVEPNVRYRVPNGIAPRPGTRTTERGTHGIPLFTGVADFRHRDRRRCYPAVCPPGVLPEFPLRFRSGNRPPGYAPAAYGQNPASTPSQPVATIIGPTTLPLRSAMSQQWERSPAGDSSSSQPTKTPKQLEEALLELMRNHPGLTPEKAKAMLDPFF